MSSSGVGAVPLELEQEVLGDGAVLLQLAPATAGAATFDVLHQDYANAGGGAGTTNQQAVIGWNAGRAAAMPGEVVAGQPSVYEAFELDAYDTADSTHGAEWHTGYVTPDGATIPAGGLLPVQWRVLASHTNTAASTKSVVINTDIGGGASGQFAVWAAKASAAAPLLLLTSASAVLKVGLTVQAAELKVQTTSAGSASLIVDGKDTAAALVFRINGAAAGVLVATTTDNVQYNDKLGTTRLVFTYGGSTTAAVLYVRSSLRIEGNVGFYNQAPIAKPTVTGSRSVGGAAVASLLAQLANLGLITDNSTA